MSTSITKRWVRQIVEANDERTKRPVVTLVAMVKTQGLEPGLNLVSGLKARAVVDDANAGTGEFYVHFCR
jgi:hypothetical protein